MEWRIGEWRVGNAHALSSVFVSICFFVLHPAWNEFRLWTDMQMEFSTSSQIVWRGEIHGPNSPEERWEHSVFRWKERRWSISWGLFELIASWCCPFQASQMLFSIADLMSSHHFDWLYYANLIKASRFVFSTALITKLGLHPSDLDCILLQFTCCSWWLWWCLTKRRIVLHKVGTIWTTDMYVCTQCQKHGSIT
jgi:hypothetical protein